MLISDLDERAIVTSLSLDCSPLLASGDKVYPENIKTSNPGQAKVEAVSNTYK